MKREEKSVLEGRRSSTLSSVALSHNASRTWCISFKAIMIHRPAARAWAAGVPVAVPIQRPRERRPTAAAASKNGGAPPGVPARPTGARSSLRLAEHYDAPPAEQPCRVEEPARKSPRLEPAALEASSGATDVQSEPPPNKVVSAGLFVNEMNEQARVLSA